MGEMIITRERSVCILQKNCIRIFEDNCIINSFIVLLSALSDQCICGRYDDGIVGLETNRFYTEICKSTNMEFTKLKYVIVFGKHIH